MRIGSKPLTLSSVLIELPTFLSKTHFQANYHRHNDEIRTMRGDKNFRYIDDNLPKWLYLKKPVMLRHLQIVEALYASREYQYSGWYWVPSSKIGLPFTRFDDEDQTIFNLKSDHETKSF